MSRTLAPAAASHYHQRQAELSALPTARREPDPNRVPDQ
jgi:hypothetical protein